MKTATNHTRVLTHQPMHVIEADINFLSEFCQVEAIVRHLWSTHLIVQFVQLPKNFKWYDHVTTQILHKKYTQWHLYFRKLHFVLGFTQDLATLIIENIRTILSSALKVQVRNSHFLLCLVMNYSISISEAPLFPSDQTEL
jgi:hypothetical protein